jgi:hypothetical protein
VTQTAYAIIVGDGEDPHVRAVAKHLPGAGLVIVDAVQVSGPVLPNVTPAAR